MKKSAGSTRTSRPKTREKFAVDVPSRIEIALVHIYLSLGPKARTMAEAAKRMGVTSAEAGKMFRRDRVQRYMKVYVQTTLQRMADREVDALIGSGCTRVRIVRRLMELADLPPEKTRDTIQGQVEAALGAARVMGFEVMPRNIDDFFKGKTDEQIENYAAYGTFEKPTQQ